MSSTLETGHAQNVANFEDLISICMGYGATYNPTNANTRINALRNFNNLAAATVQNTRMAKAALDKASNAREIAFGPLKTLCSRIVKLLEENTLYDPVLEEVKIINYKMHGRRTAGSLKEGSPEVATLQKPVLKKIPVSQQNYDALLEHFGTLIEVLTLDTHYEPKEAELRIDSLTRFQGTLKASNTAVINANTAYLNTLIARNAALYQSGTGLLDLSQEVKKYIKSVYGPFSEEYKQVRGLEFTNPR